MTGCVMLLFNGYLQQYLFKTGQFEFLERGEFMEGMEETVSLQLWDYVAFAGFFVVISLIGYWSGRKERDTSQDYFLAGRRLPWYVIGMSFIAANISSEHFIGMIGATLIFGTCISMFCWGNIGTFSFLIWLFIPFLLASRVFTIPEFLEKRFNPALRQFFAVVTVLTNILAFLAAVLYGGTLALQSLFGWPFWPTIIILGIVSGAWAIWGGLSSVAWTSIPTVIIMLVGGVMVSVLGLDMLAGDGGNFIDGFRIMLEKNQANSGVWEEASNALSQHFGHVGKYNRLSVFQPLSNPIVPWQYWIFGILSIGIWYNALNQFMIQRVLGARNSYHARMGIVLAGFIQIILPIIIVLPGLIFFAQYPEKMLQPWEKATATADKSYVFLIQTLIPVGLRGLILAALFGAIQSTVNAVVNSTATIMTIDVYKRMINPKASDKRLVRFGIITSIVVLAISIALGGVIGMLGKGLFHYIQEMYAFFAPPFAAIFLLGILWPRINAKGATWSVVTGFVFAIWMKIWVNVEAIPVPALLVPFPNQAVLNWIVCLIICVVVSLLTAKPKPERITDDLVFNWRKMNIFGELGDKWYKSIVLWWCLFAAGVVALVILFSGLFI